jgi:hypothetical protein
LAGGEKDKTELTRKVVQRAAVLAGTDNRDRFAVAARSAYAHGSEPADSDLPTLRRIIRNGVTARLILGDPPADRDSLA